MVPAIDGDRWAVHRGELSMIELCRRHRVLLDGQALRYVSHWVTPVGEVARRFDTRFFLAAAPTGQQVRHDEADSSTAAGSSRPTPWRRPTVANSC